MFPLPLVTSSNIVDVGTFWNSLLLYIDRPHLVNRKLVAVLPFLIYEINTQCTSLKNVFTHSAILYETRKLKSLTKSDITVEFLKNIFETHDKNVSFIERDPEFIGNVSNGLFVIVHVLLPKNSFYKQSVEVVILDKSKNFAHFNAIADVNDQIAAPPFPYDIKLSSTGQLQITVDKIEYADTNHSEWLVDKLFAKLIKWMEQPEFDCSIKSLCLISTEDYYFTYMDLKNKYGDKLVKEWPKVACTNPEKYVYEDIAIASYLICIWKRYDAKREIKFVDCGCGNGLLVYLLNQEGYSGYGWDIRRRQVWDIYPKSTHLYEKVVTPNSVFPDCNWLIGNHSDELTPWIPIICLNSSIETNFFVLPCCPFDLNGRKYVRKNTAISQYADYLNYIKELCIKCGFDTQIDKLRISSTKRTCLVGIRTDLDEKNYKSLKMESIKYMQIQPTIREKTEKVRNCTQLNRDLIQRIVHKCVDCLLSENNFIEKSNGGEWNKGKSVHLSELSKLVELDDLKQLKRMWWTSNAVKKSPIFI